MVRYQADQNRVGFFYESGTYAAASGPQHWIGLVQEHVIDDEENIERVRYTGQGDLNVGTFVDGDEDHTGNITFLPQDWKFFGFSLGSNVDSGSPSPYIHTFSETTSVDGNAFTSGLKQPPFSFGIEDSRQGRAAGEHFVRTLNGCVIDTFTVTGGEGTPMLEVSADYVAQSNDYSSGAPTALTATTIKPFLFNQCQFQLPVGTTLDNVKDFSFEVGRTLRKPHYGNGSAVIDVPQPQNRDYTFEMTLDSDHTWAKTLYDKHFRGGSTFNMIWTVTDTAAGAGSRDMTANFSGCRIIDMEDPTVNENTDETSVTIAPQTLTVVVNDIIELYNPW